MKVVLIDVKLPGTSHTSATSRRVNLIHFRLLHLYDEIEAPRHYHYSLARNAHLIKLVLLLTFAEFCYLQQTFLLLPYTSFYIVFSHKCQLVKICLLHEDFLKPLLALYFIWWLCYSDEELLVCVSKTSKTL